MNPHHITDTDILVTWVGTEVVLAVEQEPDAWPPDPTVVIVGHEQDAVITADENYGDQPARLGWMAGFLNWPCDAVYVAGVMPVMALHDEEFAQEPIEMIDEDIDDPFTERALVVVAHCIATNETTAVLLVRCVEDDGSRVWRTREPHPAIITLYGPLIEAAHEYDPPQAASPVTRIVARDMVQRANGTGYHVEWHTAGCLMNSARNSLRQ